jgi:hypothetical protein
MSAVEIHKTVPDCLAFHLYQFRRPNEVELVDIYNLLQLVTIEIIKADMYSLVSLHEVI